MSALEQFLCRWGRDLMVQQGEPPCPTIATTLVVLHDPDDTHLSSKPIRLCDEHMRAIAEESTATTPDRIEGWAKFWDHMEQYKHAPGSVEPCPECRSKGRHKMDCSRRGLPPEGV